MCSFLPILGFHLLFERKHLFPRYFLHNASYPSWSLSAVDSETSRFLKSRHLNKFIVRYIDIIVKILKLMLVLETVKLVTCMFFLTISSVIGTYFNAFNDLFDDVTAYLVDDFFWRNVHVSVYLQLKMAYDLTQKFILKRNKISIMQNPA